MKRFLHYLLEGFRSIAEGMSMITLWPSPLPKPKTSEEARVEDVEAIASDWQAVGDDLRKAMKDMGERLEKIESTPSIKFAGGYLNRDVN